MGSWGIKLYEDDDALDLKELVSVLLKLPRSPDEILELAIANVEYDVSLENLEGHGFWLVLADVFEKKGVVCEEVFSKAIAIIGGGKNPDLLVEQGLDESLKLKRINELLKLKKRIENPRAGAVTATKKSPPRFLPSIGSVYSFPTMNGKAFNPWFRTWSECDFSPNGWGAMIVLSSGRVYDWFPWCAALPLNINPTKEPVWKDILRARIIFVDNGLRESRAAAPKKLHFDRMKLKLLGQIEITPSMGDSFISTTFFGPQDAVLHGWSIGDQAINIQSPHVKGIKLNKLAKKNRSFISSVKSLFKK